jgi:tetratricopeptide (TPR) repeat protein
MGPNKMQWGEDECIDNDLLVRYIEKDTTTEETDRIREHLDKCQICFRVAASMIRDEYSPITEAEKEEVRKLLKLTPEEQVEKILSYQKEANAKPKRIRLVDRSRSFFDLRQVYLRYAAAAAILVVAILRGVQFYQVGFQILRAENTLKENYRIYIEDVRLSGEYASTGISKTMGEEEGSAYLDKAASRLEGALKHDQKSIKARRLLAQVAIIEGNYNRANELLSGITKNNKTPANILNDQGVLAYQQGNWATAANRFQSAIDADPNLLEARFNLALTKLKQGQKQEAATILERYIALEKNDIWKRAAMHVLQKIQ